MERKTNWIAIIVAAVAGMFLGFLWYGFLFQDLWAAGNGITTDGTKFFKNGVEMPMSAMPMAFNTVSMLVYAYLLNWLMGKTGAASWLDGAKIGALVGLCIVLAVITGNLFAMNPTTLSCVDGTYSFVQFTLMGAIIGGIPTLRP